MDCNVVVLGAGIGGSHTSYRLASIHRQNLCIFEGKPHVGGRTYDLSFDGNVPPAYSNSPIAALGAARFYDDQPVIKALADELNITYFRYDYQTNLIKARGRKYTSYNTMCSQSYVNLTCTDNENGLNSADRLWTKLLDEYRNNEKNVHNFADFAAFCRAVLGDEATDYLRDSYRFRSDFEGTNAPAYMEYFQKEWNLVGSVYYPLNGMSQLAKRMIARATMDYKVRLFLKEKVQRIDDNPRNNDGFVFLIETSRYRIRAKQLVGAMDPSGWKNVRGSIGHQIKSHQYFRAILPVRTVTIQCFWPERWWEKGSLLNTNIDRAWTRQNCISLIEITSRRPEKRALNLTRTVYDDGLCVDTWAALIERSSQADLIEELLRGLQSIFTDVAIPRPTKILAHVWPGAWHFQTANSEFSNQQIARWALKPLRRFQPQQLSLVGEAFNLDRSGWTDGAVKSSLISLTSQFGFSPRCFANDSAAGGQFCSESLL